MKNPVAINFKSLNAAAKHGFVKGATVRVYLPITNVPIVSVITRISWKDTSKYRYRLSPETMTYTYKTRGSRKGIRFIVVDIEPVRYPKDTIHYSMFDQLKDAPLVYCEVAKTVPLRLDEKPVYRTADEAANAGFKVGASVYYRNMFGGHVGVIRNIKRERHFGTRQLVAVLESDIFPDYIIDEALLHTCSLLKQIN